MSEFVDLIHSSEYEHLLLLPRARACAARG